LSEREKIGNRNARSLGSNSYGIGSLEVL